MKILEKLINKYLKKNDLITVPSSWQKEYVKLAGDIVRNKGTIKKLVNCYNELLRDYYSNLSIAKIKSDLKSAGLNHNINQLDKADLIELAVSEYKMKIEK